MKKIMNSMLLLLVLVVYTGCDAADGDVFLAVQGTGTTDLDVDGITMNCIFGICANASGEFDEVDPGDINYTYTTAAYDDSGNLISDDPDTDEDESIMEHSGSITLTANSGSYPDKGVDKACLLNILGYTPFLGEISTLECVDDE